MEAVTREASRCSWLRLSHRLWRSGPHLVQILPVGDAPARGSDQQHGNQNIDAIQAQVAYLGWEHRADGSIGGRVQQHRQQQATARVIEDPGEDDGQGHFADDEGEERQAYANEARSRSIVAGVNRNKGRRPPPTEACPPAD